jgi:hypothetical protein
MPANAAIYLPTVKVDLCAQFPSARSDAKLFRAPTYFDVEIGGHVVRFNVMPKSEIPRHLMGFCSYIRQLDEPEQNRADAEMAIAQTKTVLGLKTDAEFETSPKIWQTLFRIADSYDGYVFVHDSVLLPSGGVIVGPLRQRHD